MKRWTILLFLTALLLIGQHSYGQDNYKWGSGYGNSDAGKTKTLIKTGIGFQKSFYAELGLSRRKVVGEDMFMGSHYFYSTIEYTPKINPNKDNALYGLKFGYDINCMGLGLALETKYITDMKISDIILTPKIGFDFFGEISLYYGYNISFNKSPFNYHGHHQFSIGFGF